jgi:hypothetical protein
MKLENQFTYDTAHQLYSLTGELVIQLREKLRDKFDNQIGGNLLHNQLEIQLVSSMNKNSVSVGVSK